MFLKIFDQRNMTKIWGRRMIKLSKYRKKGIHWLPNSANWNHLSRISANRIQQTTLQVRGYRHISQSTISTSIPRPPIPATIPRSTPKGTFPPKRSPFHPYSPPARWLTISLTCSHSLTNPNPTPSRTPLPNCSFYSNNRITMITISQRISQIVPPPPFSCQAAAIKMQIPSTIGNCQWLISICKSILITIIAVGEVGDQLQWRGRWSQQTNWGQSNQILKKGQLSIRRMDHDTKIHIVVLNYDILYIHFPCFLFFFFLDENQKKKKKTCCTKNIFLFKIIFLKNIMNRFWIIKTSNLSREWCVLHIGHRIHQ